MCWFLDVDACVTPVLSMDEATTHPHNQDRSSFVHVDEETVLPGAHTLLISPVKSIYPFCLHSFGSKIFIISWLQRYNLIVYYYSYCFEHLFLFWFGN